ncbi:MULTISPECIES: hypothetical protein [Streptomyces]|uniref:hypothetical protein n=1 Tax=Streptomyces TaxID=1883 RepID=UPI001F0BDB0A|nr:MULTISPECIES: hypothetical protein [Streptomyces]
MEVPEAPVAPDASSASEESPRVRRRGRTTLLIATAAALGLVAGACSGFLIQADREPTKLPSLSQPVVAQAKGEGPEPLSAAQDRRVKTDGDLRKVLLQRPKGARAAEWVSEDGWLDVAGHAEQYTEPAEAFGNLLGDEFRRGVEAGWRVGSTYTVEIRLIQYRQEERHVVTEAADNEHYWANDEDGTNSWPIPGTGDGMAYIHTKAHTEPGYLPVYEAEAHAWRGDITMEIWVYDTKPIPKAKIMDLAERQMERL